MQKIETLLAHLVNFSHCFLMGDFYTIQIIVWPSIKIYMQYYKLTEIILAHTSFRERMSNMTYKVTILDGSEIFLDVTKGLMDEMNHILNYRYGIKWSYDPHSHNFSNCIEKPEKFRASIWHIGQAYRCVGRYIGRGVHKIHMIRLLYAIAKTAFITVMITASLENLFYQMGCGIR